MRVAASSFNPLDATLRAGYLQQFFPLQFPHTPGLYVGGTVAELGDSVADSPSATAIGFLPIDQDGAAAEFVLAGAELLTAAPSRIPLPDAAAVAGVALAALQALFELADLKPGQPILVLRRVRVPTPTATGTCGR